MKPARCPSRASVAARSAAVVLFACTGAPATAQEEVSAIWKAQEIDFHYRSDTSIYACDALRARVVSMLRAVGADENLQVAVDGCKTFYMPPDTSNPRTRRMNRLGYASQNEKLSQQAHVSIRLRHPIAATPDAIAELDKTKGYRELLGRVTGNSDSIQEAAAQFPARWQALSLSRTSLGFAPAECELIEQVAREVFPKLGVRVVELNSLCVPRQTSNIAPHLKVEALIKVPPPPAPETTSETTAPDPAPPPEPTPEEP